MKDVLYLFKAGATHPEEEEQAKKKVTVAGGAGAATNANTPLRKGARVVDFGSDSD